MESMQNNYPHRVYLNRLSISEAGDRRKWLHERDISYTIEVTDDRKPYMPLSSYWCFQTPEDATAFKLIWSF